MVGAVVNRFLWQNRFSGKTCSCSSTSTAPVSSCRPFLESYRPSESPVALRPPLSHQPGPQALSIFLSLWKQVHSDFGHHNVPASCPLRSPVASTRSRSSIAQRTPAFTIYCWLSSSANTARPSYVMPGGAKKAVFPTLALHDAHHHHSHSHSHSHHDQRDRPKKLAHQPRSKSESKDSPEKEKSEPKQKHKGKTESK